MVPRYKTASIEIYILNIQAYKRTTNSYCTSNFTSNHSHSRMVIMYHLKIHQLKEYAEVEHVKYPPGTKKDIYPFSQGTFESMIFLFPSGGICDRSMEGICSDPRSCPHQLHQWYGTLQGNTNGSNHSVLSQPDRQVLILSITLLIPL